mgnify:FL=1
MKQLFFLISICAFLLLSCSSQPTVHRENGWYLAASEDMDSIALEPVATVRDFNELRLVSDAFGRYVITGRISPHKQADWADHTEKAIGRRLAFVFNDTVVCCPMIHARIEGGNFQVSSSPDRPMDLPSIYRRLRQEKIDLIEERFKGWTKDSTLTKEQQDSIIADLDYWDAQAITHGFE